MRGEMEMLAYSLETDEELLPFMPELLADHWALGSNVKTIVDSIRALKRSSISRAIDLGCGKGAVSIALAKSLRLRVLGIDLFKPFIDECKERAKKHGVSELCEFQHGNVVKLAGEIEPADVAVFAAMGDVLGTRAETMAILRRFVRPGGFIVIDDGFVRRPDGPVFSGFEGAAVRDLALEGWSAQGDTLISESIRAEDQDYGDEANLISLRAQALARTNPSLATKIRQYATNQLDEYDFLANEFTSATWVFRRT